MEYTIPKPAYNTPRRRITELRRVPNAIPFARYSTRLHRATRRALAVDTVCKWKRKWKASTHFRTDVKAHAHCPPLPPLLPYYSPSCFLSFPTPPSSLLPPPRPLSFERPAKHRRRQRHKDRERERPAIETSIMLYLRLANVTLAPHDGTQFPCTKGEHERAGKRPATKFIVS